jgi:Rieske Fe-S protein
MDNEDDDDDENYDLLIVGGEDHQAGNFSSSDQDEIEKRYLKLESWTRERFPIEGIEYRWSGQVMEPKDSLAFIGHNPGDNRNNIYIATGDSGNGITHGTIAGIILRDLILGKNNAWTTIYDPSRKPREVPETKAGEEGQTTSQDEKLTDTSEHDNYKESSIDGEEEIASIENLNEGQGIVLEEKKIAAYKDHKGQLHTYSAVCTHLGCTVIWNNSEKSFDCPCHGSRFSPSGNVVNGPANNALDHKQK